MRRQRPVNPNPKRRAQANATIPIDPADQTAGIPKYRTLLGSASAVASATSLAEPVAHRLGGKGPTLFREEPPVRGTARY